MISVSTHNEKNLDNSGTWLQGNVKANFRDLVTLFGAPELFDAEDEGKTDAEWILEFTNHDTGEVVLATVYNYKDGKSYLGNAGASVERITDWHIGGTTDEAALMVKRFLAGL
jgi:hypothetical protein